jgi:hypothetical protein
MGEKVKLIVKKREDEIETVVDEGYNECYTDEARPFLMYEHEELGPEMLGLEKALIVHTKKGDLLRIDVKVKNE